MKAYEKPINIVSTMIIITIIMVGVLYLYTSVWNPTTGGIKIESGFRNACKKLVVGGCSNPSNIPLSETLVIDGVEVDNLQELCEEYYGCSPGDKDCCKEQCGC